MWLLAAELGIRGIGAECIDPNHGGAGVELDRDDLAGGSETDVYSIKGTAESVCGGHIDQGLGVLANEAIAGAARYGKVEISAIAGVV